MLFRDSVIYRILVLKPHNLVSADDRKVEGDAKEGFEESAGSSCILAESADGEDNLLQTADVSFGQRPVVAGGRTAPNSFPGFPII